MSPSERVVTEDPRLKGIFDRSVAQIFHNRLRDFEQANGPGSMAAAEFHVVQGLLQELNAMKDSEAAEYMRAHERYLNPDIQNLSREERGPFRDRWFAERKACTTASMLRVLDATEIVRKREDGYLRKRVVDDFAWIVLADAVIRSKQDSNERSQKELFLRWLSHPSMEEFGEAFGQQFGDLKLRNKNVIQPILHLLAKAAIERESAGDAQAAVYLRAFQKLMVGFSQIEEDKTDGSDVSHLLNEWAAVRAETPMKSIIAACETLDASADAVETEHARNYLTICLHMLKADTSDLDTRKPPSRQSSDQAHSPLQGLIRLFGTAAFKTFDRVRFILDREFPDGADTIDILEFARLCTLTGPAFYQRVADLKKAHFAMRSTKADTPESKPKDKEDPIRRIQREDDIWNTTWDCVFSNAAKRTKKIAETMQKWKEEGYTDQEIQQMREDVEREIDRRVKERGGQ